MMDCSCGTSKYEVINIRSILYLIVYYKEIDVFDSVSGVYTLKAVKMHCESVMCVVEEAHMKDKQFRTVLPLALQISGSVGSF